MTLLWEKLRAFVALVPRIGIMAQLQYMAIRRRSDPRCGMTGLWRIRLSNWPQPVVGRYGTSDLNVFRQIFIEQEHGWARLLGRLPDGALIIDCGANVGYASIFFLRLFPNARVVAVEPDGDNFAVLEANLAHGHGRGQAIRAGIWSHKTRLRCSEERYRDGLEWSRQVQECAADDPESFPAVSIGELLDESGAEEIALLKIDIEGAEAVVFGGDSCHQWLSRTGSLAIELHEDSSFGPVVDTFAQVMARQGFRLSSSGELTVATRERTAGQHEAALAAGTRR
jgi:FkbM family methyltransferase